MSERLSKFLSAPQRPEGTLGFHQVQGLLFAIACSPELVMPSEWMPLIFNGEEANYASIDEAESVTRALMDLYNAINARAMQGESDFPRDVRFRQPSLDNLEDAPLGQWSYGFVQGHDWLSGLWDHYIPEELDEELGSSVLVLSFFASRKLAEAYHQEMSQARPTTLEAFADKMLGLIEDAMNSYAHLAYSIRTALAEHSQSGQPYVGEKKVGRNDPCPCGSGRKYKKCCLQ